MEPHGITPWSCALIIAVAGAFGGVINALVSDNGFILPTRERTIWCPGFVSNVIIGAFSAFASWAFYGSGAGVELAKATSPAAGQISLTFSAVAGAFLVGVAGAKWLTNEVDKKLLTEGVKVAATNPPVSPEVAQGMAHAPARQVLRAVEGV